MLLIHTANVGTKIYFVKCKSKFFYFLGLQVWGFFDIILYQREMKKYFLFLFFGFTLIPGDGWAATSCSRANLTRCLDSVCAINVSSNPAARCQYCGTANAGTPKTGMRSVSVGASAQYNISEKELKKAPSEPFQRYAWAAEQCLKKVAGCTTDDVSDVYDSLIEQSCKAAGVAADMKSLAASAAQGPTASACNASVEKCVIGYERCGADFSNCKSDAELDKVLSLCAVEATGCDTFMSDIRAELVAQRDTALKNAERLTESIIASYENARAKKAASAKSMCTDNAERDACVKRVCATNMVNKCAAGFESEVAMATQLCKFYDIACNTLK